jgi:hypothetical protein
MKHHPAECLAKGAFGRDCANCDPTAPLHNSGPRRITRKCACCSTDEAEWAFQPFGPSEEVASAFMTLGSHYRGFPSLQVCDACKSAIQEGRPVYFSYKKALYMAERWQVWKAA